MNKKAGKQLAGFQKTFNAVLAMGLSSAVISACGAKSDPIAQYKDVIAQSVPPADSIPLKQQNLVSADFFTIDTDGDVGNKMLLFYEGENRPHNLTVNTTTDVKYRLIWRNSPANGTLVPSPTVPNVWLLQLPVPTEHLAQDELNRPFAITLELEVLPGSSKEAVDAFSRINKVKTISGLILPNAKKPQIVNISGLETPIKEGEERQVTVDVSDPGADKTAPHLFFAQGKLDPRNHESDGTPYLHFANRSEQSPELPSRVGSVWRFKLSLDAKSTRIDHSLAHKDAKTGANTIVLQASFYARGRVKSAPVDVRHFSVQIADPAPTAAPAPVTLGTQAKRTPAAKPH